jgi:hypothetical protein
MSTFTKYLDDVISTDDKKVLQKFISRNSTPFMYINYILKNAILRNKLNLIKYILTNPVYGNYISDNFVRRWIVENNTDTKVVQIVNISMFIRNNKFITKSNKNVLFVT